MAKKNSMKRSLIFSVTSVMLSASMFVGTTFAWFTDSVTSKNNIIQSGNLDVELYYQTDTQTEWTKVSSSTNVFKDTLWEPGHTEVVKLQIANEGSLDLKYQLGVNIVKEDGSVNVEGKPFKLSDFIQYGIVEGANNYDTREDAIDAVTSVATDLNVEYNSGTTALSSKKSDEVTMVVYMPEEVGNEANHAKGENVPTIELGLNLVATQLASEEDSFGPDYDKDAWADGFEVGTAGDLQAALNNGVKDIVLTKDIETSESIVIPASEVSTMSARATNATVIDLNGKKITGTMAKPNHVINNQGTLFIKGGEISSTAANGGSAIYNEGTLTVENTTINGASIRENGGWPSYPVNNYGDMTITNCTVNGYQGGIANSAEATAVVNNVTIVKNYLDTSSHAFYNSGTLTINGGTYSNNGMDGSVLYNYGSGNATINGGTFSTSAGGYGPALSGTSTMKINGGTFNCGLLAWGGSAVITGGTFSSQPKAEFLAEGYKAIKTDNVWTVTFPQESVDSFIENATAGDTVQLPAGTYSFPASKLEAGVTVECAEGTVFTGTSSLNINGATVIGGTFKNEGGQAVSGTINGTFKNCTFEGNETLRWCYSEAGTTTVFENCVINTNFRGVHFDGMNGDVIFKKCEINGFNAYSGTGTMTFENCTFGNDKSNYNGLNIYTNTNLINCTFNFNSGKTNFIDMEGVGKTLTITDCTATLDGKAAAVEAFIGGSKLAQCKVVFNGATLVINADKLLETLEKGENVFMATDVAIPSASASSNGYGATGINVLNGQTIDGNGNALSINKWGTWDSAINTTGGLIKNIKITGGMRGIFVNHNSTNNKKVILENVIIDGTIYTISCDQGTNQGLEATNSTFNGWTSYAATIGNVKFNNCNFGEGQGYAFCRPYAPTEFVGCNFEAGFELDAAAAVTFKNCTIGGVALTAENLATLVVGNLANASVK